MDDQKMNEVKDLIDQLEQLDDESKILVATYTSALADRERMERNKQRNEALQILQSAT
jgi:hypothetical protein